MKFQTFSLLIAASTFSAPFHALASSPASSTTSTRTEQGDENENAIHKKQSEDIVTMDHYSPKQDMEEQPQAQGHIVYKKDLEDIVTMDHYSPTTEDEAADRRLKNTQAKGLRGAGKRDLTTNTTCSKQKKVSIYKFCIEGDCDAGAEGEHRLKMDGHWLYNDYKDFREGQCHSINYPAQTVDAWKSLTVGTEEHDTFSENDSWFATMAASAWYSETCETYEIILSKKHTQESQESMCWEVSAGGNVKGVDLGLTATRCSEWTKPSESFLWYLKVEPAHVDSAKQDNPIGWYDSDGPQYNCEWYSVGDRCSTYGYGYSNFGKTAKDACQVCGGGTGTINGSTFKIKSQRDGNYIDTNGCDNGADVYYKPGTNTDGQRFYWGPEGQLYNKECGKVVDIHGGSCSDGTNLIMWPAHTSGDKSNQQWKVNSGGELESLKCGNKVVDHASYGTVLLWSRHGGSNQKWDFV